MLSYKRALRTALFVLNALVVGLLVAPTAAAEEVVTAGWTVEPAVLADGRSYFVNRPTCAPAEAPECVEHVGRQRPLVVYLHAAGQAEDLAAATKTLTWLRHYVPETVFAFGVSLEGTRGFDAGSCCTAGPIDEVGYLAAVVDDVVGRIGADRSRVGLLGVSNGGMLAQRGICERPTVFRAAASISGSYPGACNVGRVRVRQWHGAVDNVVPVNGGRSWILGQWRWFPSAASLAQRMLATSEFELRVLPGLGHFLPAWVYRDGAVWLDGVLTG